MIRLTRFSKDSGRRRLCARTAHTGFRKDPAEPAGRGSPLPVPLPLVGQASSPLHGTAPFPSP